MGLRPASWPLVVVGMMGIGIGVVGFLFYVFTESVQAKAAPVASGVIAAIGAISVAIGWFYDPPD